MCPINYLYNQKGITIRSKQFDVNTLTDLSRIRKKAVYSSTNLIRGALLNEMHLIFQEKSSDEKFIRKRILHDNIIHKNSFYNRENAWRIYYQRYNICPDWIKNTLAQAADRGPKSTEFTSLAYLYYILHERLVYDFIIEDIWNRWMNKAVSIETQDAQNFILSKRTEIPQLSSWSESTIIRCSQSMLTAIRDFGLIRGINKKSLQRMAVTPEAIYQLLCILYAEGVRGYNLISSPDWRIFLWRESDVVEAFLRLAQLRWIRFERSGSTIMLEFIRLPGDEP